MFHSVSTGKSIAKIISIHTPIAFRNIKQLKSVTNSFILQIFRIQLLPTDILSFIVVPTSIIMERIIKMITSALLMTLSLLASSSLKCYLLASFQQGIILSALFLSLIAALHLNGSISFYTCYKNLCLSATYIFYAFNTNLMYDSILHNSFESFTYCSMLAAASFTIYFCTIQTKHIHFLRFTKR